MNAFLQGIWDTLAAVIKIIQSLKDAFGILVTAFVVLLPVMADFISWAVGRLAVLVGTMTLPNGLLANISAGISALRPFAAFANAILPLDEAFAYCVGLSVLWLTCATYRFVKSWVPTLS